MKTRTACSESYLDPAQHQNSCHFREPLHYLLTIESDNVLQPKLCAQSQKFQMPFKALARKSHCIDCLKTGCCLRFVSIMHNTSAHRTLAGLGFFIYLFVLTKYIWRYGDAGKNVNSTTKEVFCFSCCNQQTKT